MTHISVDNCTALSRYLSNLAMKLIKCNFIPSALYKPSKLWICKIVVITGKPIINPILHLILYIFVGRWRSYKEICIIYT
ncbi:hypothetical protein BJX68DRAFT_250541 [Aspergillus pseudodeflectus]|uniref:Uncharacterized protein n=1 Tax=Aspergillus pseudodeflectus TaxID=176178 RepID=A0ABR4JC11_9EURO